MNLNQNIVLNLSVKASAKTKHINEILKWSVIDDIKRSKDIVALKKIERKKKNFVKVEGLDPANNEGGLNTVRECTSYSCRGIISKNLCCSRY